MFFALFYVMALSQHVLLFLSFAVTGSPEEISPELFQALNPSVVNNEKKLAQQIIAQFRSHHLKTNLEYYIVISNQSPQSKSIAAEVLTQLAENEDGDEGLLSIIKLKRAPEVVTRHALNRVIQKLSKATYRQLPRPFQILPSYEKRSLANLILKSANGKNNFDIAAAVSNFLNFDDAQLFISSFTGDEHARAAGSQTLARMAEKVGGEFGLVRMALRTDFSEELTQPSFERIKEILGSLSGRLTKLKMLDEEQKIKLVSKILDKAKESEKLETSSILMHLDREGDLETILRGYSSSTNGIEIAAKTVVRMKIEGRSDNISDNALIKLSLDASPYIRREAAEKIRNRISRSSNLSPVFRLLDPHTKQIVLRSVLDSIASSDRDALSPSIQQFFQSGESRPTLKR
jgi:hypothetical protein